MQRQVTREDIVDIERYLRWADTAMEADQPGKGVYMDPSLRNRDREVNTDDANLKIARHEPLMFECIRCDYQFDASGKSLNQIAGEVADHIAESHPEMSDSDLQQKKAA